ncbi:restriction endonuclease [Metabacillus litoralis]|uniref:restriction endonuclease n=1 Tax=Metabacillus litoralis TaxID=152268 RepID=UPI00203E2B93|nr:restriction endonuclease [Metabacillus litoralis]MCM3412670.1 restriction endonuclease [Metabacillus litoralis]
MGRRGYRRKRAFRIDGIVFLVILTLGIVVGVYQLLKQLILKYVTFFSHLNLMGWLYTILFCAFLVFSYHLANVRERKIKELKKIEEEKRREQLRKKQIERMTEKSKLEELKNMDFFDFERFIKELYELLGYQGKLTPKSGDGGKDIILKHGAQTILVECKRYNSKKVSRPEIQKFHSALIDMNAHKGIFVTTSDFSKYAIEYVSNKPIELVNGEELINLLKIVTSDKTNINKLNETEVK